MEVVFGRLSSLISEIERKLSQNEQLTWSLQVETLINTY